MFHKKSYTLYGSFYTKPKKMMLPHNRTFFFDRSSLYKSNSNTTSSNINFPFIKKSNNYIHNVKRTKSFKKTVDYKFYKLLQKTPLTPKNRNFNFYYPEIIDKSPFNCNLKDEQDETLKRIKKINKANKKHKILCDLAYKKEIKKRKEAKKFFKDMKLTKINIKLVKKKEIEEQKLINGFKNLRLHRIKKMHKLQYNSFEHPKTTAKNIFDLNGTALSINNLFEKERKLVLRKDKLMHRFHEIMNKIYSKNENENMD